MRVCFGVSRLGLVGLFVMMFFVSGCRSDGDDFVPGEDKTEVPGEESVLVEILVTPSGEEIASGSSLQFVAEGVYSGGVSADFAGKVEWRSSNTGVAGISVSGLATAGAEGSTTITATFDNISGSALLKVRDEVSPPAVQIDVQPANPRIRQGAQQQFLAIKRYQDGSTEDISTEVSWGSSNELVATVDESGFASGVGEGTATITAVSGNITGHTLLTVDAAVSGNMIIDHTCRNLDDIPAPWIEKAKSELHIAYGHTSHGSQLTTGMKGLVRFKGELYAYNNGGTSGALDLRDRPFAGDLGNPDRTTWADRTRTYLESNVDINVVIWSWCGQVSSAREQDIETYLDLMCRLEDDYPDVAFVYMTGHLDGSGLQGNLHLRNEQIRSFCRENNKILYDFADIETYDPDGTYYGDKIPNDACNYDSDNNGTRDLNWAEEWQTSHTEGDDWYDCDSAHSKPLNANLKAYAAWWLWARLAGRGSPRTE